MIESLTPSDIAAEAEMIRSKFKSSILFLEGLTDKLLFDKFVDNENCYTVITYGKENAIGAIEILEARKMAGILAIVDADFFHINSVSPPSKNILFTDETDIETGIFLSNSFDLIVREYTSVEKVEKFLKNCGKANLREAILEKCLPIGLLRLISLNERLNLKFKGIKYKGFVEAATLNVDITKFVNAVVSNTKTPGVSPIEVSRKLQEILKINTYAPVQLCRGHDLTELLGIGLKRAIGSHDEAIACQTNMEVIFRLTYSLTDFKDTKLYEAILNWENDNKPFLVLMKPK